MSESKEHTCKYNNGVDCQKQDMCKKCGWMPGIANDYLREHYDYPKPLDIVMVVRCKDCINANADGTTCRYDVGRHTTPDGYCDRGKRRDTDG